MNNKFENALVFFQKDAIQKLLDENKLTLRRAIIALVLDKQTILSHVHCKKGCRYPSFVNYVKAFGWTKMVESIERGHHLIPFWYKEFEGKEITEDPVLTELLNKYKTPSLLGLELNLKQISPCSDFYYFDITENVSPISDKLFDSFGSKVIVDVSADLSKIEFYFENKRLKIKSPKLLLETLYRENSKFRLSNGGWVDPSANKFDLLDECQYILKHFGDNTVIKFDEVVINWINDLCPWPPSIDALFLASTLKHNIDFKKRFSINPPITIADVGCGTGFLGVYFSKIYPSVEKVYYSDSNPEATRLAIKNHENNKIKAQAIGLSGFGLKPFDSIDNLTTDLIFCNPPYIPSFSAKWPVNHPVYSSGFLSDIIANFPLIGKNLFSCLSCVAKDEIERGIKKAIKTYGNSFSYEILDSRWVPFRVKTLKESNLKILVDLGLILDIFEGPNDLTLGENILKENFQDNRSFRYWHQINIYKFSII